MNLFHSARLKLTTFYFASLVVFCLILTFGVHAFTNHELSRGDDVQRGVVHKIFEEFSSSTPAPTTNGFPTPFGDRNFAQAQRNQADVTRQHLNRDFVLIDVILLAVGAVISYWYAGRTLRPIEEAHESQKRFTSDASHELRTPLTTMKVENEVFLRQTHFTEAEARKQLTSNLEEVDRLERLASNLLALNRYEQAALSHTPVVIGTVVSAAVERMKRHPEARMIHFNEQITPAKVDVHVESMVELLTILLDNAVKYGPSDGTITIQGELVGEHYVLSVIDQGPGISPSDLPHIFERMYRGDKARSSKVEGHGIGLSLARQIAQANEATLSVHANDQGGSTFRVSLR